MCVCTGSALTAVVAATIPSAIVPLTVPPELDDAVDAQREKVRMVRKLHILVVYHFIFCCVFCLLASFGTMVL